MFYWNRGFITENHEFFFFTKDKLRAYLLLTDMHQKAPKEFGLQFFDTEFEPSENQIRVQILTTRELTDEEMEWLSFFAERLLNTKPHIDWISEFKIFLGFEFEDGPDIDIQEINEQFKTNITINDEASFNHLLQK